MLELSNFYKEFMIQHGAYVRRFDKNGREYADIICLQNDLYVGTDSYLVLERCEECDAISAKFAVDSGYMMVGIEALVGFYA